MGVLSMKGGDGEHSYANNSEGQVRTVKNLCIYSFWSKIYVYIAYQYSIVLLVQDIAYCINLYLTFLAS